MSSHAETLDALGGGFLVPRDRGAWFDVGVSTERSRAQEKAPELSADERRAQAIQEREAEWVRAASRGSMAAFEAIVRRYQRPILSLILRKVRDHGIAEDLAQETFIKAHRALDTFDSSRRLASWLFKIANNTAIDYLRKKRLPEETLDRGEAGERSWIDTLEDGRCMAADRQVFGQQIGQMLQRALTQLRPDYREVLILRFVEGLSYLEVAEVTDQPLGTVKTKIHRARRDLSELLSR